MKLSEAAPIVVGILAFAGVLWQGRRPRFDSRDRLKRDLELLEAMPDDLAVKAEYKQHISKAFELLIRDEDERSRDPRGVVLGIILMIVSAWLLWTAFDLGGWWHVLTAFGGLLFIVAAFGTAQDVTKHHRDERGRVIARNTNGEEDGP
ncbi:hypothetical protein [Streptomyces lavendulocolor]|uniref:hypothetical protein n=1 Tax=Streptomyces lavendulocolor TaxID=67316 RepID=UPI003C2D6F58